MNTEIQESSPFSPSVKNKDDRIVWADCEMTGLDLERHVLVEIAIIVTDANLTPLDAGIDIVIHATEEQLSEMDDFVQNMHNSSGLTEEIRSSTTSIADAEREVLDYLKKFIDKEGTAPLAGNSIATDRRFIAEQMPALDDFLHYRMIDASTLKELSKRWSPRIYNGQPPKGMAHRALQDTQESIKELQYYRSAWLRPNEDITPETISSGQATANSLFDMGE